MELGRLLTNRMHIDMNVMRGAESYADCNYRPVDFCSSWGLASWPTG